MAKKANKRKTAQAAKAKAPEGMSRRRVMTLARNGAIGVVLLAGAAYGGTQWFQSFQNEHDLGRIGQGIPAVVQVHDPQCPMCTALQRQTRKAMKAFDEDELLYLVADIRQDTGAAFAAVHNVPHVTLVLMDGQGKVTEVLQGVRDSEELSPILAAHVEAYRKSGVPRS